jgi:hypothetical protein
MYATGNTELLSNIMLSASFRMTGKHVLVGHSVRAINELQRDLLNRCLQKYSCDGNIDSTADTDRTS